MKTHLVKRLHEFINLISGGELPFIGCLASSTRAEAEKAAIDLVALAKEHVDVKKQLADARDALAFIDRILTNDPNPWAFKAAIAACRKQLLKRGV